MNEKEIKQAVMDALNLHSSDLSNIDSNRVKSVFNQSLSDESTMVNALNILSKITSDLTTEDAPDYSLLSGRIKMEEIRFGLFGGEISSLMDVIKKNTEDGWYTPEILESYSSEEIYLLDKQINHDRDFLIGSAGAGQLVGKYLIQNRVTKEIKETPQFAFMLMSMVFALKESGAKKIKLATDIYNLLSTFKISLPTPVMAGLRTKTKQFSSCTLIEAGDSLDEINAASSSVIKYISQRAGIGLNIGMIRALGSPIRNGEAFHTGLIPFIKHYQTAVKSCSQGGVRGGAATLFYPVWHLEFESLITLKNNRGVEENRARHLDYGVQLNKLMYQRLIAGQNITLFSPGDVPGLYDAFFEDQNKFEKLYIKYEKDENIRKKEMKAVDVFQILAQERVNTGRIYVQNVDHTNSFGSFLEDVAPVKQSNLCMEITLPTKPLEHVFDEEGEIALCTLGAINMGEINKLSDIEPVAENIVRMLDFVLDYQNYPVPAAKKSTENRRTLGVGVINWSYYLAKNKVKITDGSALKLTHEAFEAIQFYLLKASNKLAKEKGVCPKFSETKYSKGILPIDNYKKDLDTLGEFKLNLDWESLRQDILEYGLRNSTLSALMPSETSSQVSGSTNGIEPPLSALSIKSSKDGNLVSVVPELTKLRDFYEFKWDIKDNKPYLNMVGIMQKFVDQSISTNTNYDPKNYAGNKTPIKLVLQDILHAYKMGLKTLYYHNTRDGSHEETGDCESGGCII